MSRTEPSKEDNDKAIRELKREMRGELPIKYKDARNGDTVKIVTACNGWATYNLYGYAVRAIDDCGQNVEVAFFAYDSFDGGKRKDAARMLAEELTDRINENA